MDRDVSELLSGLVRHKQFASEQLVSVLGVPLNRTDNPDLQRLGFVDQVLGLETGNFESLLADSRCFHLAEQVGGILFVSLALGEQDLLLALPLQLIEEGHSLVLLGASLPVRCGLMLVRGEVQVLGEVKRS